MAYNFRTIYFYGDPIHFLVNKESAIVGARSLVSGMGLSWGTQSYKIRNCFPNGFSWNTIKTCKGKRKAIFITRQLLEKYLDSIDISKVKEECKKKVEIYKSGFLRFSYKSVTVERQHEIAEEYTSSINGLYELIYDTFIRLGNERAMKELAVILNTALTTDIGNTKLPMFERENCPKTRNAFIRAISEIDNKMLSMTDPVIDMSYQTAAKKSEVERIKSNSIQSRIESVAEKIRNDFNKEYLELKKISKIIR